MCSVALSFESWIFFISCQTFSEHRVLSSIPSLIKQESPKNNLYKWVLMDFWHCRNQGRHETIISVYYVAQLLIKLSLLKQNKIKQQRKRSLFSTWPQMQQVGSAHTYTNHRFQSHSFRQAWTRTLVGRQNKGLSYFSVNYLQFSDSHCEYWAILNKFTM